MTDGHIAIEAMDLLLRDSARVSGSRVKEWLATRDPDVLSAVYLAVSKRLDRLEGGVAPEVYFDLVKTLFDVLPRSEGLSDYALSRLDVGTIYAAFLRQCARELATSPGQARLLSAGAEHLALAYKAGDERQRRYIVDGIIEHVFPEHAARAAFSAWRADPLLRVAYEEAAEWDEA